MKKIFFLCSIFIVTIATIFVACKKENDVTLTTNLSNTLARAVEAIVTVNQDYGFLVFSKVEDLENFRNQIVGNTHGDVRAYLNSIEFTSLGKIVYESVSDEAEVTEEQAICYLLSTDGVVQVKEVIMKQINQNENQINWEFFLTLNSDQLNAETYSTLSNGTFNSNIMNKFACGDTFEEGLFEFIEEHPFGHEATTTQERIKFWGWNDIEVTTGPCPGAENCICIFHYQRYTIFWTWTGSHRTLTEETGLCS